MARQGKPTLYVLAGPEGSGRTTFAETQLSAFTRAPVISADKVQSDIMDAKGANAMHAGDLIAHKQAEQTLSSRRDFVYETRMSDRRDVDLVDKAQQSGYRVVMFHLQTKSAELSVARVAERVKEGGRDADEKTVRADYAKSPPLIREVAQKADLTFAYDTSALNQLPKHVMSLERGQITKTSEQLPQWARDTYSREMSRTAKEPQLSPAAASYLEARSVTQKLAGPDAKLGIAGHEAGTTRGPIVAESKHHLVQQTGEKEFVAHFKDRVAVQPQQGQEVAISYGANRDRGTVSFGKEQPRQTEAQNKADARDYATKPREQALKDNPRLASAYAAEDALKAVAAKTNPVNSAVENKVGEVIKQTIKARLENGQTPEVSRPMVDSVKFQVASRSLEQQTSDKLVHPEKQIRIDPKHKEILVSRADAVVQTIEGKVTNFPQPDKAMNEVRQIAGNIARLEEGREHNPFGTKTLQAEYNKQADQQREGPSKSLQRTGKGMDR